MRETNRHLRRIPASSGFCYDLIARVLAHLGQPAGHPHALNHPEGFSLKGLWLGQD